MHILTEKEMTERSFNSIMNLIMEWEKLKRYLIDSNTDLELRMRRLENIHYDEIMEWREELKKEGEVKQNEEMRSLPTD